MSFQGEQGAMCGAGMIDQLAGLASEGVVMNSV
jgi:hypothetical protein